MTRCTASFHLCECGLDEHPANVPHECEDPDPQCGGSWLDHPTMPTHAYVVRFPGIRLGGPNEGLFGLTDPAPGEWPLERRYDDEPYRAPRGGIRFYPPPSLRGIQFPIPDPEGP